MKTKDIIFSGRILDNVHGFIPYTEAESKIMDTELFKRLQSIKQLSIANWIFPGSEHTRYIHSLGVMHVADKIALSLKLSTRERKIVRMAGLLHDIGHYPLSHVCEAPYKHAMERFSSDNFCKEYNQSIKHKMEDYQICVEKEFMRTSSLGHHEDIGCTIIRGNKEIRKIISNECGEDAIEIICDMIDGKITRENTDTLLVQILHSEMDADGIDYMLRDATFSGTSFGAFEVDQLINNMEVHGTGNKRILCINPKAIAAADQYLINKYFSFSQVVFNKHISILEWMAEQLVVWMIEEHGFPKKEFLISEWLNDTKGYKEYLSFTDNYFWEEIKNLLQNDKGQAPDYIKNICTFLLSHKELRYVPKSEIKIITNNSEELHNILIDSNTYKNIDSYSDRIVIFSDRQITKHVPYIVFYKEMLENLEIDDSDTDTGNSKDTENLFIKTSEGKRLMDSVCVKDGRKVHPLCDDPRSLMQALYGQTLVVVREYEFFS